MTEDLAQIPSQLFPLDVLDRPPDQAVWRVAHTKSRREKKLTDFLAGHNIGYYLPLLKRRQARQQRTRYSFIPAFGNYVFIKATDNERHLAMRSHHIARVIEVRDQARLVKELQQIKAALIMEERVYPYDYLSQGQRVRIIEGPLRGLEGVVERKKSGFRLVLTVSSILQAVALDIDAEMVVPIDAGGG